MDGWYYLHTNGDLIFKIFRPDDDSPFVRHIWPCDTSNRETGWRIILESLSLGASIGRVKEIADKWECDLQDFIEMILRVKPSELMRSGADIYLREICNIKEPENFWRWLGSTPPNTMPDLKTLMEQS